MTKDVSWTVFTSRRRWNKQHLLEDRGHGGGAGGEIGGKSLQRARLHCQYLGVPHRPHHQDRLQNGLHCRRHRCAP